MQDQANKRDEPAFAVAADDIIQLWTKMILIDEGQTRRRDENMRRLRRDYRAAAEALGERLERAFFAEREAAEERKRAAEAGDEAQAALLAFRRRAEDAEAEAQRCALECERMQRRLEGTVAREEHECTLAEISRLAAELERLTAAGRDVMSSTEYSAVWKMEEQASSTARKVDLLSDLGRRAEAARWPAGVGQARPTLSGALLEKRLRAEQERCETLAEECVLLQQRLVTSVPRERFLEASQRTETLELELEQVKRQVSELRVQLDQEKKTYANRKKEFRITEDSTEDKWLSRSQNSNTVVQLDECRAELLQTRRAMEGMVAASQYRSLEDDADMLKQANDHLRQQVADMVSRDDHAKLAREAAELSAEVERLRGAMDGMVSSSQHGELAEQLDECRAELLQMRRAMQSVSATVFQIDALRHDLMNCRVSLAGGQLLSPLTQDQGAQLVFCFRRYQLF